MQSIIGIFGKISRILISSGKSDSVLAYLILCYTSSLLLKILAKISLIFML